MAKFHITYNPYRVETSLKMQSGETVLEESGLLYISKMRLQRWAVYDKRCYFDELFEASGDNEIEIIFSGTSHDLNDLVAAANKYQENHAEIRLVVNGDKNCRFNDNTNKINKLKSWIDKILKSPYSAIMPNEILKNIRDRIENFPKQRVWILVDFEKWSAESMHVLSNWPLMCMRFSFHEMRLEKIRRQFQLFAKYMFQIENRNIQRERFIFLCEYADDNNLSFSEMEKVAKRFFLEHGLQDLQFFLLTPEEIKNIENYTTNQVSNHYNTAKQVISNYVNRYDEQYKAKKIYDLLKRALTDCGFKSDADLTTRVKEIMTSDVFRREHVVTYSVTEATNWIRNIVNELRHILDIESQ